MNEEDQKERPTSSERVYRNIQPALLQAKTYVHSNGMAQCRLSFHVKLALQDGAVWRHALCFDLLYEGHQTFPHLHDIQSFTEFIM